MKNKLKQETLLVTLAMICSTLALLWKFQYFKRRIYITQKNIYDGAFIAKKSKPLRRCDRYLKNGESNNIAHVIKHANFQLYRAYPARVIWKKLTTDGKYVNKRVRLFINQTRCLSNMTYQEEKNTSCVMYV